MTLECLSGFQQDLYGIEAGKPLDGLENNEFQQDLYEIEAILSVPAASLVRQFQQDLYGIEARAVSRARCEAGRVSAGPLWDWSEVQADREIATIRVSAGPYSIDHRC